MNTQQRRYDAVKRGIDIVGAGAGLLLLSPVMGATAVLVRAKLGSPVLFTQQRPGLNGKVFRLYKFRSMLNIDEKMGLISDESRLTRFGQILRSTSLDELPSLINVLKGEMSLVGPRPLLVSYLDRYTEYQFRRHEVRPGITGLAQIRGRNSLNWDQKFAFDIDYVTRRSFLLDVSILWGTLKSVIAREGISHETHATMEEFTGINNEK